MTRGTRIVFMVFLLFLCLAVSPCRSEESYTFGDAAELEGLLANNLPRRDWDADKVREVARNIASLPGAVATEVIWAMASAPPQVNTVNFFGNALGSSSPEVRKTAASVLINEPSFDFRRLVLNMLATEKDEEVVRTIVQGFTHLPRNQAVNGLMDVMLVPGVPQEAVALAGTELRRLTRADVMDDPGAWRDWWLDNEDLYR